MAGVTKRSKSINTLKNIATKKSITVELQQQLLHPLNKHVSKALILPIKLPKLLFCEIRGIPILLPLHEKVNLL
jgi:hypothetical protein